MRNLVSPVCLLLALAMVIAGFAVWAVEPPEAGVDLHRARVEGDDSYRDVLEAQLRRRQWARTVLLACLFTGAGVMTLAAFAVMRPSGR